MRRANAGCIPWILVAVLAGGLLYIFRQEFFFLGDLAVFAIQGHPAEGFPELLDAARLALFLLFNLTLGLFVLGLLFYWTASSAFPTQDKTQVAAIVRRIIRSLLGEAFEVQVVREGVLVGETGPTSGAAARKSGGVTARPGPATRQPATGRALIVDLESAVVIEHLRPPKRSQDSAAGQSLASVKGPGLVVLGRGERLRDVVHLRKQHRTQSSVLGQTSDGIELRGNTFATFSISQPPDVIQVAYVGQPFPGNLCLLRIDPTTRRITDIRDELDEQDQAEIHAFAQDFLYYVEPNSPLTFSGEGCESPPYPLDPERILAGVYSRARNVSDRQSASHWTDLPVMVASETFRNLIARYTLDALFLPDDPQLFPLNDEVKPEFARRLRYMGVMAYQFLQRQDGEHPQVDQRVDHRYFRISPPKLLVGSKMLRDRGIKVIDAGFSEVTPTEFEVNQQRVNNWKARWQQEANLILSDQDRELLRIQNQTRLQTQREQVERLAHLFEDASLSEETLAQQLIQSLEGTADELSAHQFLPKDGVNRLRAVREWLLPGEAPPDQPGEPALESEGEP